MIRTNILLRLLLLLEQNCYTYNIRVLSARFISIFAINFHWNNSIFALSYQKPFYFSPPPFSPLPPIFFPRSFSRTRSSSDRVDYLALGVIKERSKLKITPDYLLFDRVIYECIITYIIRIT